MFGKSLWRSRTKRSWWACLLSIALVVPMAAFIGTPASADEGDPEYLQIEKSISSSELTAGDQFTYQIQVTCSEADCVNATIDDAFPPELAGFPITNVSITPDASTVPRTVTWNGGDARPDNFTDDTELHVDLQQPLQAGGVGLSNGTTFTITVTSEVPQDQPPGEVTFTNTANTTADNAQPVSDNASATIVVAPTIGVDATKAWAPENAAWNPGTESTITVGVTNTSNAPVQRMVLQEPQTAPDGASALDPNNPFVLHDFTGFDGVSIPPVCESTQVDAYVQGGDGTWNWVSGTPATDLGLPDGVTNEDVGGLRVTCIGTDIPPQTTMSFEIDVTQRDLDRNTGESFEAETRTTDNVVEGQTEAIGYDPAIDTATASHTITPTDLSAGATKNIEPARIPAGDSAAATISGTNTSSGPVSELRISDLDYFTEDVTFGGFSEPPTWPEGATSAEVIYYPLGGGNPEIVPFDNGQTPAPPSEAISGFEIVYSAEDDAIIATANASAAFTIDTDADTAADGELATTNNITTTVNTASGRQATADASDDLTVVDPSIVVDLAKSILPATAVLPGESVTTSLTAVTASASEFIDPKTIVVEDSWGDEDDFWNAFNLSSVAPTQVPPNSTLEVAVEVNGEWVSVASFESQPNPRTVTVSQAEIEAAIDPATMDDVTGIRFTFTADDVFPAGTTVAPYFTSTARAELRDGSGPTTPGEAQPVTYTNAATTTGTGVTPDGQELEGTDDASDDATIISFDGVGPGALDVTKSWSEPTVDAQSGQTRATTLSWGVAPGYDTVTLTDPLNAEATENPEDTVFQAFNLIAVNPIAPSDQPYANGWWFKYDTVTAVELYNGSGWVTVPEPAGGWNGPGGFVGYDLSGPEQQSTTGVRLIMQENTAAREAAQQDGPDFDPYAPDPGSGVGSTSTLRTFDLTWQIRDKTRVGDQFVTAEDVYNTSDPGVVNNTVRIDATDGDTTNSDSADADILILDQPPAVNVVKTASDDLLYIPPADSPADAYPSVNFGITAQSESTAAASYVRLTDPMPCDDGDLPVCNTPNTAADASANPYADVDSWDDLGSVENPFDRFTMTSMVIGASVTDEVDLSQTTVWLLEYVDGSFSSVPSTAADINSGSVDLTDVVGFSITYQGSDPAEDGGTITSGNVLSVDIDATLRSTIRSTSEPQTADADETIDVTNYVFAQSYDPVTADEDAIAADNAQAGVVLSGGTIDVVPSKTVDPDELPEPQRDDPVTVTLGATSGDSTLPSVDVTLEDQALSPDFWNSFDFIGLGAIAAPDGADQVQVDVYGPFGDGDELTWAAGTPSPLDSPTLAVDEAQYPDVQGIRFTFSKADGTVFSTTLPAPAWSADATFEVQLRDEYRDGSGPTPVEGSVENTVTVQNNGQLASSDEETAPAEINLSTGTHDIEVNKLANEGTHFATPGTPIPWRLQFQNTGTGYLTVDQLQDTLPEDLVYLPNPAPTYTAQEDGLLSEDVTLTQDGQDLIFTWPDDGNTMAPGEIFEITLYLELQPVAADVQVENTMVVHTEETLDSCANISPDLEVTDDFENDPTTCGTTDYVEPTPGPNLFTLKGVQGSLDGAINPNGPDSNCLTFETAGETYYRSPCAANSVVGGVDQWVLHVANAGTTPVESMTIFDQLPVAGDQQLVSGASRGSQYKVELVAESLQAYLPEGTIGTIEVTTDAGACVNTWPVVQTKDPCTQNGETWTEVTDGAEIDWSNVTGVRMTMDFTSTPSGGLQPGDEVNLVAQTQNTLISEDFPEGVSPVVPTQDEFAWNQFGVKYHSAGEDHKIAPAIVGVHLLNGPIQLSKAITGPGATYAATSFDVDVTCTLDGVDLNLGEASTVTLTAENDYAHRIDGIPLGADCTLQEAGDLGAYGETSRSGTPVTLDVDIPAGEGDPVPEAQVATITNDYQMTGLSITKQVTTDAVVGDFGPFDFTLACTSITGIPITFGDEGTTELTFTLTGGETFTAPENTIPVGAECTVAEVDSAAADSTIIIGDNVTDNGDGTATVTPGAEPVEVIYTNAYDAGVLAIEKVVDGNGADLYGAGPFTFEVLCTWQGQTVVDASYDVVAGGTRTIGPLPTGTVCSVQETFTGGANSTTLEPDGEIVIEPDAGEIPTVSVMATNTFDVTELVVTKEVTGDEEAASAAGEFTIELTCTRPVDGQSVPVDIPGGAQRSIAAGESTVYPDLPVDATCDLAETDDGGAENTSLVISGEAASEVSTDGGSGSVTLGAADDANAVLTNHFEPAPPGGDGPPPVGPNPAPDGGGSDSIASTGADVWGLASVAVALVLAGLGVLAAARRHRL